jgi:hypothetical protein
MSKSETNLNPEIRMTEKTAGLVSDLGHSDFVIVSDFDIRISDFSSSLSMRPTMIALLVALVGCGGERGPVPPAVAPATAEQAMAEFDANKDGALDAKELEACPGLAALAAALGKSSADRLTADELGRQIDALRDVGFARTRASCRVMFEGRPLAGAAVRYIPERFLGPAFRPATGTTDAAGYAWLVTDGEADGITPGLYRVEVSKPDAQGRETIPVRYNARTTLGGQIGFATRGAGSDVVFQLKK